MKKYLFLSKNNNKKYIIFFTFFIIILLIYIINFFVIINQKYFIISNLYNNYYLIPEDKEGEKVKFIEKKSINNFSSFNKEINNLNFNNLNFTIQLFSDPDYQQIKKYIKNTLQSKSEIIVSDELFIFSIDSDIGIDYFLTYKNFKSKIEAINFCKKLSFVKKCLILNPQN